MKLHRLLPNLLIWCLFLPANASEADIDRAYAAYEAADYKTAFREFKLLAEQGNTDAQNNLGVMYANGMGISQEYKKAVEWYTAAAEQNSIRAQYNLGVMYADGTGVLQDYGKRLSGMRWQHCRGMR